MENCIELWDCTTCSTIIGSLSLLVQFYSYYFDCLVFKYFALSAGLDCSYVVLGVQYAMGQFLC